jgi:hypothetical protein
MVFCLLKLTQEANVAIEEQAQIIHAISEHGQTVGAHAEGKANEFFGVQAHVANHVRDELDLSRPLPTNVPPMGPV